MQYKMLLCTLLATQNIFCMFLFSGVKPVAAAAAAAAAATKSTKITNTNTFTCNVV